jgi:hypothetical protein
MSQFVATSAAIHKTAEKWHHLPVSGTVVFQNDMNRSHQAAELPISICVLQELSWKFCIYFCMGFGAQVPGNHIPHAVVVHILYLCWGRNQSLAQFCVHPQIFFGAEFHKGSGISC